MQAEARAGDLAERWLGEAYDLVERGWCQGASAQNAAGQTVDPASASACRWSPAGALMRAWRLSDADVEVGLHALQLASLALTAATNEIPKTWNDAPRRTHREALEAILDAVSLAQDPALFGGTTAMRTAGEPPALAPQVGDAA